MQLTPIKQAFKPITIAAGMIAAVPTFAYSDIDAYNNIINSEKTMQYMQLVDTRETDYFSAKFHFQLHLQRWEQKTKFQSSVYRIIGDEDFKAIVGMGEVATPLILAEIQQRPSTLVWALNFIYGKKISNNSNLTISEACKLWIKELS
ncbi:MAG: hypothetical protein IJ621_04125 [Paludibacteraceae bacterium]|nr:hypothetical protein [Paludibacteraceae bacterium]